MSSFLVPVKGRERLEVSGSYPLNKIQASDRVSGTIRLHAYLHLPDLAYLEGELLCNNIKIAHAATPAGIDAQMRTNAAGERRPSLASSGSGDKDPNTSSGIENFGRGDQYSDALLRPKPAVPDNLDSSFLVTPVKASGIDDHHSIHSQSSASGSNSFNPSRGRSAQITNVSRCLDSLASLEFLDVSKLGSGSHRPQRATSTSSRMAYSSAGQSLPSFVPGPDEAGQDDDDDDVLDHRSCSPGTVASSSTTTTAGTSSTTSSVRQLSALVGGELLEAGETAFLASETDAPEPMFKKKLALRRLKERQAIKKHPRQQRDDYGFAESARFPPEKSSMDDSENSLDDVIELHTISLSQLQSRANNKSR
jgi:hypothetical protein